MRYVAITAALLLVGCEPKKTLSVPIKFCREQQTGNIKEQTYPQQNCVSYDSRMNCIVPVTTWQTDTWHEVRVQCDWIEWK